MTKPHKHAAVIKAWADGKEIEFRSAKSVKWESLRGFTPMWQEDSEYRVKPEPRWQKEREAFARGERIQWRSTCKQHAGMAWRDVPAQSPIMGPAFDEPTNEFRIPHKWQAEMDAWERGEDVQCQEREGGHWWTMPSSPTTAPGLDRFAYRITPKTQTIRRCLIRNSDGSVRTGNAKTEAAEKALETRSDFLMWCGPRKELFGEVNPTIVGVDFGCGSGDRFAWSVVLADGTLKTF